MTLQNEVWQTESVEIKRQVKSIEGSSLRFGEGFAGVRLVFGVSRGGSMKLQRLRRLRIRRSIPVGDGDAEDCSLSYFSRCSQIIDNT